MNSIYHGSVLRFVAEVVRDGLRSPRRVVRQLLGRTDYTTPELAEHFKQIKKFVANGETLSATKYACEVAEEALRHGDAQTLSMMSRPLERLEEYGHQARFFLESRRITRPIKKEWNGDDLPEGTLAIDYKYRNVGIPLRHARLLAPAAERVKRCVALAESRLIPLYQRTFPNIEFRDTETERESTLDEADAVACYTDLLALFATEATTISSSFIPLRPDPSLMRQIRKRYQAESNGPLVGISWGSSNRTKSAPRFSDWSEILQETPATFVSLQYGEIESALRKLRQWAPSLIHDESIDQLKDMDSFAAQVASLDAVISTSNTIAHLAGALGVPSVIVLNNDLYQPWPFLGSTIAWYPKTRLVRNEGQRWPNVLKAAQGELHGLLTDPSR